MILVPLSSIDANPWQPRLTTDPETLEGIKASILKSRAEGIGHNGFWQPLLMRKAGKRYQIPFGHTRLAAYKLANPDATDFPGDVVELTDRQMSDMAAEENSQRKDLTAIETARAIERRMKDFKISQLEAGAPFGYTSQGSVANLLRLLKLPADVQNAVADGTIPERAARQMVQVTMLFPKDVAPLIAAVKEADPDTKDEALAEAMQELIERRGQSLHRAPFDLDWPDVAIPLNGDSTPDLTELRKCVKCPFHFSRNGQDYCLQTACYQRKVEHALKLVEANACKKLNLPPLADGEKAEPIFEMLGWQDREKRAAKLIAEFKKDPSLGLRVTGSMQYDNWLYKNICGDEHAAIVTTNPEKVRVFCKGLDETKSAPKPAAKTGATVVDTAAEEAAREERRAERARKLRVEHDCAWLIKNATIKIAPQLTISGHVLRFVVGCLVRERLSIAESIYGLRDWYEDLDAIADKAKGKDADDVLRQMFIAAHIFRYAIGWGEPDFGHIHDAIADLATEENDTGFGLGFKLPKGWDAVPIHKTNSNCWHCGQFAGQRDKLTNGDIERGWMFVSSPKGTEDVVCPDCTKKLTAPKAKRK